MYFPVSDLQEQFGVNKGPGGMSNVSTSINIVKSTDFDYPHFVTSHQIYFVALLYTQLWILLSFYIHSSGE